jgi:hypothetical protein
MDDLNPTGYAQVVEESVNGSVQRSYSYGLQHIDEIQLVNNSWTLSFYGYDGFGSVRQLTNAAGAVTDTYEYDAFSVTQNPPATTCSIVARSRTPRQRKRPPSASYWSVILSEAKDLQLACLVGTTSLA